MESKKEPMRINPWLRGMVPIPNWLLIRTEIGPSAKLAVALLAYEVDENGVFTAGVDGLARLLGTDRTRTLSILNELGSNNLLEEGNEGWVVVVPSSWTDARFELDEKGEPRYLGHEPGQWWMQRSPYVRIGGYDEEEDAPRDR